MSAIQVGIVGFGRIGLEHAKWIAQCEEIAAAAVADSTGARRELAKERGLRLHSTIEELLEDSAIDAVLISTPTAMHFEQASAALKAGKHVMVEKPMAVTLDEAQRLVELARENRRVLTVFQNRRWRADSLTIRAAMESGVFGRIINIESRLGQWASCVGPAAVEYHPNWRNEASFGGGALFDWGSHFVDQLLQVMLPARALRVFAQLRGNVWSKDCDDFARVCIDFDNGAVGLVEVNTTTTAGLPRWHIDGTRGSAQTNCGLTYDHRKWAELDFTPAAEGAGSTGRLPVVEGELSSADHWTRFARAIGGGGEPAITAESVLPTMAVLDAARKSSEAGMAVQV
jgi:scyllo-inositol 2-dehydrogenase (NADP+)